MRGLTQLAVLRQCDGLVQLSVAANLVIDWMADMDNEDGIR